jgi:hypothetical protein
VLAAARAERTEHAVAEADVVRPTSMPPRTCRLDRSAMDATRSSRQIRPAPPRGPAHSPVSGGCSLTDLAQVIMPAVHESHRRLLPAAPTPWSWSTDAVAGSRRDPHAGAARPRRSLHAGRRRTAIRSFEPVTCCVAPGALGRQG